MGRITRAAGKLFREGSRMVAGPKASRASITAANKLVRGGVKVGVRLMRAAAKSSRPIAAAVARRGVREGVKVARSVASRAVIKAGPIVEGAARRGLNIGLRLGKRVAKKLLSEKK